MAARLTVRRRFFFLRWHVLGAELLGRAVPTILAEEFERCTEQLRMLDEKFHTINHGFFQEAA